MDNEPADSASSSAEISRDMAHPPLDVGPDVGSADETLTPLHPNYVKALRVTAILASLPFLIAGLIAEASAILPWPGLILGPISVIALFVILRLPVRRFVARGYNMSADRLRVVRGIWWRSDSVVPFGRVQHIDVDQGPLERMYGIATRRTAGPRYARGHPPTYQTRYDVSRGA